MKFGEGSYLTLFSPSDVTTFHRMQYGPGGGAVIQPCFHRVTSLRVTELVLPELYVAVISATSRNA